MLTPILAKNPYDEPGKPGTPELVDWDKDHVDIKWTPPESVNSLVESYSKLLYQLFSRTVARQLKRT
jgi:hypothetical protein